MIHIVHELAALRELGPIVAAAGFFDGFHAGHQAVLAEAKRLAAEKNALPGVITFHPHPEAVLFPERPVRLLETEEEKERYMEEAGMAFAAVIRPTKNFLAEAAEDFLKDLAAVTGLRGFVCGENFTFGAGAAGGPAEIERYFAGTETAVRVVPMARSPAIGGRPVSSTEIRRLLSAGDVKTAALLLGRRYALAGDVAHGFRRGTDAVGYPTANLAFPADRALPADGVYASFARVRGKRWPAVTNVGTNPTFGVAARTVETFVLDFDGSIYGEPFAVEFAERLRGEIRFSGAEALAEQIGQDIKRARQILAEG